METLRRELRFDPHLLKQFRHKFLRESKGRDLSLGHFPTELRDRIGNSVCFHPLTLNQRLDSELDGASKLLFRTQAGKTLETVVLRTGTGRTALCLSSQIGCAAACEFCATGYMGIAQNLTAGEILDQIVQAGELLVEENRRVRNLVFMGMGEPFHNEENLHLAVEQLLSPKHFDWPASRIMVSTVGVTDAMVRFVERFPRVNLALSLHSANQSTRKTLIPLAQKYPLEGIRAALEKVNSLQTNPVMIEYLMLAGTNDSAKDAKQLIDYLDGLNAHVNLIPFNEIEDAPHLSSSTRETRDAFANIIRDAGYVATIRYSLGTDIEAACGQLVRKENRHPALHKTPIPDHPNPDSQAQPKSTFGDRACDS